jgi:NitT/TauT family transport system substrate-binding protein
MHRRFFLQIGSGILLVSIAQSCKTTLSSNSNLTPQPQPNSGTKIVIGHATVASGLPFFCAVEKGFFKEAGLELDVQKMVTPQHTVEGMIGDRIHGCSNGTATGSLAVAAIASPDLFRIIAANNSNQKFVLDEIIVPKNSPIQAIADLDGKAIACGMGPQNLAIARGLLAKNGVKASQIVQMEFSQHVAAVESGQVAAAYTLEPSGTVGTLKGLTRTLETGVVAKYILEDPLAPWFGGAAVLTTRFIQDHPDLAKQYITAYRKGVEFVRQKPDEARQFLTGYTAITGDLTKSVPLADYRMYDEFTPQDLSFFQKYFDFLQADKVLAQKLDVASLIYRG